MTRLLIMTLALPLVTACGGESLPAEPTTPVAAPVTEVETEAEGNFMKDAEGTWTGKKTLWTKYPDDPQESAAKVVVSSGQVDYEWSYKGDPQTGTIKISEADGVVTADWVDSWHSKDGMTSTGSKADGAIKVSGTYSMGDGPEWTWRTEFHLKDPQHLEIKMFNGLPDGLYPEMKERELPAVVMELERAP